MAQFFTQAFEGVITEDTNVTLQTEIEPTAYEMIEMAPIACRQDPSE